MIQKKSFLLQLRGLWKEISEAIADFQVRLLLTLLYFSILIPFAVAVRLFANPNTTKDSNVSTAWGKCTQVEHDLEQARHQY